MSMITTKDGTQLFYKDWGPKDAQPIVFHHGWPLTADDWDAQMLFFLGEGYRVVAFDRRGQGRARGLAEAERKIEQRLLANFRHQAGMARLNRIVRDQAMIQAVRTYGVEQGGGRGAGKAVEHHRNACLAGGKCGTGNGGKFAPAKPARRLQRIAEMIFMQCQGSVDGS